jgi:heme/copper-type cytochrome/quinol oxidase subunit 3
MAGEHRARAMRDAEAQAELAIRNRRLGLTIFQISWIMVFVSLIVVNWQLRFAYPSWPPPEVPPFDRALPSVATALLLLSGWLVYRAQRSFREGARAHFLRDWGLATALGVAFLAIMVWQFFAMPAVDTQYIVVARLMIGYHALHALVIGAMMAWVWLDARAGQAGGWAVEGTARLWAFVIIAWILFYIVLYWI